MRLHMPYMLCFTGFETLLLVLLMLAAEGWCIIWESPRLLKYYILLAGALFLMDVCFKYVHKYFQVMIFNKLKHIMYPIMDGA